MSRILSLSILRVDVDGPRVVAAARPMGESAAASSSSASSPYVPSEEQIRDIVHQSVRLHYNNTGKIELENLLLSYRVSLSDSFALCYLVVSEPLLQPSIAQDFLATIQESLSSDPYWQEALARGECVEQQMIPTLTQFIMTENSKPHAQNTKINSLNEQVEGVKKVMQTNVELIMERGERLENIQERTENLVAASASFKQTARSVQRKFCMLNAKWTIILTIGIILLVVVVILIILSSTGVIGGKN